MLVLFGHGPNKVCLVSDSCRPNGKYFLFLSISADVIEAILGNDLSYDCFVLYSHILKLFYTISNRVYPSISKSPKQLCTYIVNKNEINLHSLWNMPENLVECLHFCLFLMLLQIIFICSYNISISYI